MTEPVDAGGVPDAGGAAGGAAPVEAAAVSEVAVSPADAPTKTQEDIGRIAATDGSSTAADASAEEASKLSEAAASLEAAAAPAPETQEAGSVAEKAASAEASTPASPDGVVLEENAGDADAPQQDTKQLKMPKWLGGLGSNVAKLGSDTRKAFMSEARHVVHDVRELAASMKEQRAGAASATETAASSSQQEAAESSDAATPEAVADKDAAVAPAPGEGSQAASAGLAARPTELSEDATASASAAPAGTPNALRKKLTDFVHRVDEDMTQRIGKMKEKLDEDGRAFIKSLQEKRAHATEEGGQNAKDAKDPAAEAEGTSSETVAKEGGGGGETETETATPQPDSREGSKEATEEAPGDPDARPRVPKWLGGLSRNVVKLGNETRKTLVSESRLLVQDMYDIAGTVQEGAKITVEESKGLARSLAMKPHELGEGQSQDASASAATSASGAPPDQGHQVSEDGRSPQRPRRRSKSKDALGDDDVFEIGSDENDGASTDEEDDTSFWTAGDGQAQSEQTKDAQPASAAAAKESKAEQEAAAKVEADEVKPAKDIEKEEAKPEKPEVPEPGKPSSTEEQKSTKEGGGEDSAFDHLDDELEKALAD